MNQAMCDQVEETFTTSSPGDSGEAELASLCHLTTVTAAEKLAAADGQGTQAVLLSAPSGTISDTVSELQKLKDENALLVRRLAEQTLELRAAQSDSLLAMELKAQFMANVSHELRTPMSGVLGMAELLKEMPLSDEQKELVHYIYVSAAGLVDVVNSLLDFSRLQAGKLHIETSQFSVTELLAQISSLYSDTASKKGIVLSTVKASSVPDEVIGDGQRIKQVLSGLTNNAIKFSKEGSVQISVGVEKRFDNIVVLSFRVKDNGIGIEASEQDRLFLPFAQADGSNTRKYGGVGLGLPICARLVKLMSGSMSVKSRVGPGHGSTFSFSLPLEIGNESSPRKQNQK